MIPREFVPLRELTTLRVGGTARYVAECHSVTDIQEAVLFAKERDTPFFVLGGGSNVLASDEGYTGVIVRLSRQGIVFTETAGEVLITAEAATDWNALVDETVSRGYWGIENLAGIPGTAGAAPVQNIGAYGVELADVLVSVEVFDTDTNRTLLFNREECSLAYRESRFKQEPQYIILRCTLRLSKKQTPHTTYKDITAYIVEHGELTTPIEVAQAVRAIRARKFPDLTQHGTAGSFFKNPTISTEQYRSLLTLYPELPGFEVRDGIKIPLAWILDHVLTLRGFRKGFVYCYYTQPLVLVTEEGATANDVDVFAKEIEEKIVSSTKIKVEREVRTLK